MGSIEVRARSLGTFSAGASMTMSGSSMASSSQGCPVHGGLYGPGYAGASGGYSNTSAYAYQSLGIGNTWSAGGGYLQDSGYWASSAYADQYRMHHEIWEEHMYGIEDYAYMAWIEWQYELVEFEMIVHLDPAQQRDMLREALAKQVNMYDRRVEDLEKVVERLLEFNRNAGADRSGRVKEVSTSTSTSTTTITTTTATVNQAMRNQVADLIEERYKNDQRKLNTLNPGGMRSGGNDKAVQLCASWFGINMAGVSSQPIRAERLLKNSGSTMATSSRVPPQSQTSRVSRTPPARSAIAMRQHEQSTFSGSSQSIRRPEPASVEPMPDSIRDQVASWYKEQCNQKGIDSEKSRSRVYSLHCGELDADVRQMFLSYIGTATDIKRAGQSQAQAIAPAPTSTSSGQRAMDKLDQREKAGKYSSSSSRQIQTAGSSQSTSQQRQQLMLEAATRGRDRVPSPPPPLARKAVKESRQVAELYSSGNRRAPDPEDMGYQQMQRSASWQVGELPAKRQRSERTITEADTFQERDKGKERAIEPAFSTNSRAMQVHEPSSSHPTTFDREWQREQDERRTRNADRARRREEQAARKLLAASSMQSNQIRRSSISSSRYDDGECGNDKKREDDGKRARNADRAHRRAEKEAREQAKQLTSAANLTCSTTTTTTTATTTTKTYNRGDHVSDEDGELEEQMRAVQIDVPKKSSKSKERAYAHEGYHDVSKKYRSSSPVQYYSKYASPEQAAEMEKERLKKESSVRRERRDK